MGHSSRLRLTLTRWERELILKHGYPFDQIQAALAAVPESRDSASVLLDRFEVEQLLGDLARSINDCNDGVLQEELNELYEVIEAESRR